MSFGISFAFTLLAVGARLLLLVSRLLLLGVAGVIGVVGVKTAAAGVKTAAGVVGVKPAAAAKAGSGVAGQTSVSSFHHGLSSSGVAAVVLGCLGLSAVVGGALFGLNFAGITFGWCCVGAGGGGGGGGGGSRGGAGGRGGCSFSARVVLVCGSPSLSHSALILTPNKVPLNKYLYTYTHTYISLVSFKGFLKG